MKEKIFNIFEILFTLILIALVIFIIYFNFNYQIYIVNSGSMQPTFSINELVITKKGDTLDTYQEGDIITYYSEENDIYITHRVVEVVDNGYITKGDYNNVNDPEVVNDSQIIGKVVYNSLFLGNLFVNYKFALLFLFVICLVILIILFSINNKKGKEDGKKQ